MITSKPAASRILTESQTLVERPPVDPLVERLLINIPFLNNVSCILILLPRKVPFVKGLDAAGFDVIIIETVGAGQADLDILGIAHTILVVLAPGLGDEIQAIKAGIMEIASIFVINKMDREDSLIAIKDIEDSLSLLPQGNWKVPVVGLDSIRIKGYEELIKMIDLHFGFSESVPDKNERVLKEITEILRNDFNTRIKKVVLKSRDEITKIEEGTDPYTIADELSKKIFNNSGI